MPSSPQTMPAVQKSCARAVQSTARRRQAAVLASLGAVLAPVAAIGVPQTALAASSSDFQFASPALAEAQVGQRISLRISPTGSATLDCSSLSLQAVGTAGSSAVSINWRESGCWTGGANLVTSIQPSMVGQRIQMRGHLQNGNSAPTATITVGDQKPSTAAVDLPKASAALSSEFTFAATGDFLPQDAAGRPAAVRIQPSGAQLDCSSISVEYADANGTWHRVAIDHQASGCWVGGTNQVFTPSRAMLGRPVRITGTARRDGANGPRFDTGITIDGHRTVMPTTLASSAGAGGPSEGTQGVAPTPEPTVASTPEAAPIKGDIDALSLPRVPWEGGHDYYRQFPDAVRGGWAKQDHFPIAVWWGGGGTDAELQADKKLGINTYIVTNPGMDAALFARNGMSYIGHGTNNMERDDPAWVGDYLDDEVDGRFSAAEGFSVLDKLGKGLPDHDKVRYANFTGMVISWHKSNQTWDAQASTFVNDFTDVVSMDAYWFSSEQCDWADPRGYAYQTTFEKHNCRSGQAYGRNVESLRWRDAQDGKLQPVWNFIENVDVAADGTSFHDLTAAEVKAAAMSSIIHEARGLLWFNQSFGGKCSSGNAVADARRTDYPCRDSVLGMGEINNLVQRLAPVLNTQSYEWKFGEQLETMLKVHDGHAYVLAMSTDDAAPGQRRFTVPPQLRGRAIEVVGENRTITPSADGSFTDDFASIHSYHVYRIG